MKNLNVLLPDRIYAILRGEARRSQVPATTRARRAIESWLRNPVRLERHAAIAAYAAEMAGTLFDLDPDLEIARLSHLSRRDRERCAAR